MQLVYSVYSRLQMHIFLKKSLVIGPFLSQNIVSITFFTNSFPWNFFLYQRINVSTLWTIFSTWAHSDKSMFNPFVKVFFDKICFFVHITHSSVNFTWFVFLSHQRIDRRPLFKPRALCLISNHFEKPRKRRYIYLILLIYCIIVNEIFGMDSKRSVELILDIAFFRMH